MLLPLLYCGGLLSGPLRPYWTRSLLMMETVLRSTALLSAALPSVWTYFKLKKKPDSFVSGFYFCLVIRNAQTQATTSNGSSYLLYKPSSWIKTRQVTAWVDFIASSFINNLTGGLLEVSAATVYRQTVSDQHRRDRVYLASGGGEKQLDRNQPICNTMEMKPESW